ncbi:MAG: L-aspartate oxidase [Thermoplasmata archaeon]|jgi:hypothetical protein|nr:L-aspartate oxidase [Thermoplasmata archaeon]
MVLETGVIVAGTGYAGSAVARELARDPAENAPYVLLDKEHGEMVLDIILSESGDVAGALVAREGRVEPLKAPVVVLATGNVSGLFPGGDWKASGDGFVVAHRAGLALARPLVVEHEGRKELRAGVPCKADGATALAGLYVAGSVGSDRPDPARLARAAIRYSRKGVDPMGPYRQQPTIDSPLPEGFADVKFERLRGIMARALSAEWDAARTKAELHRLKGEADEFARARVDLPLFSLQNACEAALLLLKDA